MKKSEVNDLIFDELKLALAETTFRLKKSEDDRPFNRVAAYLESR